MRAYDWLLRLYPASFRAEYGSEMRAIFARKRLNASGVAGLVALWLEAIGDVAVNATRVQWEILRQDIRHGWRVLARTPGFTVTAIVLTALGTGATTVAFSLADHVLIRPVRFPDRDRLVRVWQDQSFRGYPQMEVSPGNYRDWQQASSAFERLAAYTERSANMVGAGEPQRLEGAFATGEFFGVLRARAAIGRVFTPADAQPSAMCSLVISDSLWRGAFGRDMSAVGQSVLLNGERCTIVGVMPRDFDFPSRTTQFWKALSFAPGDYEDRSDLFLRVVGRLKPDVSIDAARSELRIIAAELERKYPQANLHTSVTVRQLGDEVGWRTRLLILAVLGASACVLLIACTNLAALLLTRASTRQKEFTVRAAIGGGKERLVRQMLTESLLLAAAGGLLGILLARLGTPLVGRLIPASLPVAGVPPIDARVLAFAAAVTAVTGVAFGLVPALRATRTAESGVLREGFRAGQSLRTRRVRGALVVAQVAATIVLLISAGLLLRALWQVERIDPGFSAGDVLTLRTSLPQPKYRATAARERFYRRVLGEVRALPGVASAAYISFLPMVMRGGIWPVTVDGEVSGKEGSRTASLRLVTAGFFRTLSIPLLMGRDIAESDREGSRLVAVVSESFVTQHWPGQNPLGRTFHLADAEPTVVGVVGDIRVRGLERESEPQMYLASQQMRDGDVIFYAPQDLVVKLTTAPGALIPAVRNIIARADPEQPISNVRMLSDIVAGETEERLGQARILALFAIIATFLAAVGIHGLLAFNVSTRTREIGLRLALGATPFGILALVVRQAVLLGFLGVALGLLFGRVAGQAMSAVLAGVSPADLPTLILAVVVAGVTVVSASALPALRAMRTPAATALREG
jgi:putative ABC transport system permease protein